MRYRYEVQFADGSKKKYSREFADITGLLEWAHTREYIRVPQTLIFSDGTAWDWQDIRQGKQSGKGKQTGKTKDKQGKGKQGGKQGGKGSKGKQGGKQGGKSKGKEGRKRSDGRRHYSSHDAAMRAQSKEAKDYQAVAGGTTKVGERLNAARVCGIALGRAKSA